MPTSPSAPVHSDAGGPSLSGGSAGAGAFTRAHGLELLGPMEGSGYREPPLLVRRGDGQILQLTAVLYAVLSAIDGRRDAAELAQVLQADHGLAIEPADIEYVIDQKLRPLGVVTGLDGAEPQVQRSRPLLGLRGRVRMVGEARTQAVASRFAPLFRAPVVVVFVALFLASSAWLFMTEELGSATRTMFHQPGALLAVLALTIVSAAFHEVGHAAACRYGGATPGAMGAGLYLVWPAFYTDVTDSYRLDRRGRLRVDLGGLYFNAVFSVVAFGVWLAIGWDPLLIVMFAQLFQMARQLTPLVRFDGYHVLADLVGVPDLFARIRPVLTGMLPTRWRHPEATQLKPWARAVVTGWVLAVVPILLFTIAVSVFAFPRLAATAADGLGAQWVNLRERWTEGDLLAAMVSALAALTIALPVAAITFLLARIAHRAGRRAWNATGDNPPARRALVLGAIALATVLLASWWPRGQYEPIHAGEPLSLPALATPGLSGDGAGSDADAVSAGGELALARATHGVDVATAPETTGDGVGGYRFSMPAAPRAHDNQAVAVGYRDGGTTVDTNRSLDWATAGDVDHRNEAYALASCADCRTTAVAFQVVLVVGDNSMVTPMNKSVAKNVQCLRCNTRALAVQLVLPLDESPDSATRAAVDQIWSRTAALEQTVTTEGFAAAQALIHEVESDLVALLAPGNDVLDETTTSSTPDGTTTTTLAGASEPAVTTTSTSAVATTEPDSSTTTSATVASTTTSATTEPSSTTTASPP